VRSGFDEGRTDALAPKVRFDKKPVELAGNHRGEAGDSSPKLGDQHLAFRDLLGWNFDDFGMRLELFAILGKREGRPALKRFEVAAFFRPRQSDRQRVSAL